MIYKAIVTPFRLAKYLNKSAHRFNPDEGRFFGKGADKFDKETEGIPLSVKRIVFTSKFGIFYVITIMVAYVVTGMALSYLAFFHSALWLLIPALFVKGLIGGVFKDVTSEDLSKFFGAIAKADQESSK